MKKLTTEIEPMVNTGQACEMLGVGRTYMAQVKREMGISGERRFFVSDVARHLKSRLRRPQDHQAATAGKNGGRSSKRGRGNA